ncbi:programmed cell death protein 2 [Anthonomus grandis grandis]|uniref:programmed cell death protein 2 n=1 Tax=Anthonomus grandis grandis TaxID=2921223 RepID=UPI0021657980|nr:programmed cell death protein 2 [Anthonomus grandis grandis]
MPKVELGFLEECESWHLESRFFPSKVGGKPAWLSLKPLPSAADVTCKKCLRVPTFLCQIYAPFYDSDTTDKQQLDNNFHRSVFLFVCRNPKCNQANRSDNIIVLRNCLAKQNSFYPATPPEVKKDTDFDIKMWAELCNLCGIYADKRCSKCKNVVYCCKEHQILDWKNAHKLQCSDGLNDIKDNSGWLFPEWELIIESEDIEEESINEQEAMEEYEKLKAEGKTGTLTDIEESDLDAHAATDSDKVFSKFKKKVSEYPDQVIRYSRGGQPLFIAKEPLPDSIPDCEYCGGPRQFEFQVMPQILSCLKEYELDWGVILVYTCKNSCVGDSINSYKREYVFKQDVSNTDVPS